MVKIVYKKRAWPLSRQGQGGAARRDFEYPAERFVGDPDKDFKRRGEGRQNFYVRAHLYFSDGFFV